MQDPIFPMQIHQSTNPENFQSPPQDQIHHNYFLLVPNRVKTISTKFLKGPFIIPHSQLVFLIKKKNSRVGSRVGLQQEEFLLLR